MAVNQPNMRPYIGIMSTERAASIAANVARVGLRLVVIVRPGERFNRGAGAVETMKENWVQVAIAGPEAVVVPIVDGVNESQELSVPVDYS